MEHGFAAMRIVRVRLVRDMLIAGVCMLGIICAYILSYPLILRYGNGPSARISSSDTYRTDRDYHGIIKQSDWFVVEGRKVYLDISPRQLDALEGKLLFWDQGIRLKALISD